MVAAKAWVSLLALIVTSIVASPALPITGDVHEGLTLLSIILGALITYWTPNKDVEDE